MGTSLRSWGLRLLVAVLAVLGLCAAAVAGFLALVAFLDARHRCPGIECSDAIGTMVMGVMIVVVGLLGALAGLGWLAKRPPRP